MLCPRQILQAAGTMWLSYSRRHCACSAASARCQTLSEHENRSPQPTPRWLRYIAPSRPNAMADRIARRSLDFDLNLGVVSKVASRREPHGPDVGSAHRRVIEPPVLDREAPYAAIAFRKSPRPGSCTLNEALVRLACLLGSYGTCDRPDLGRPCTPWSYRPTSRPVRSKAWIMPVANQRRTDGGLPGRRRSRRVPGRDQTHH